MLLVVAAVWFSFFAVPEMQFHWILVNGVNVEVIILFKQAKNHLIRFLYHSHSNNSRMKKKHTRSKCELEM